MVISQFLWKNLNFLSGKSLSRDQMSPNTYDIINEQIIFEAKTKTKSSAGSSGIDADLYRRILCSKNFNSEGKIKRKEIFMLTKNDHPYLLESYTSCKFIILDKNSGIRPIGLETY